WARGLKQQRLGNLSDCSVALRPAALCSDSNGACSASFRDKPGPSGAGDLASHRAGHVRRGCKPKAMVPLDGLTNVLSCDNECFGGFCAPIYIFARLARHFGTKVRSVSDACIPLGVPEVR